LVLLSILPCIATNWAASLFKYTDSYILSATIVTIKIAVASIIFLVLSIIFKVPEINLIIRKISSITK
jgi:predicted signal transduction protein with EAL and GGDEF domain